MCILYEIVYLNGMKHCAWHNGRLWTRNDWRKSKVNGILLDNTYYSYGIEAKHQASIHLICSITIIVNNNDNTLKYPSVIWSVFIVRHSLYLLFKHHKMKLWWRYRLINWWRLTSLFRNQTKIKKKTWTVLNVNKLIFKICIHSQLIINGYTGDTFRFEICNKFVILFCIYG